MNSKEALNKMSDYIGRLGGGEIKNVEDYDKIKEWLDNDK